MFCSQVANIFKYTAYKQYLQMIPERFPSELKTVRDLLNVRAKVNVDGGCERRDEEMKWAEYRKPLHEKEFPVRLKVVGNNVHVTSAKLC